MQGPHTSTRKQETTDFSNESNGPPVAVFTFVANEGRETYTVSSYGGYPPSATCSKLTVAHTESAFSLTSNCGDATSPSTEGLLYGGPALRSRGTTAFTPTSYQIGKYRGYTLTTSSTSNAG